MKVFDHFVERLRIPAGVALVYAGRQRVAKESTEDGVATSRRFAVLYHQLEALEAGLTLLLLNLRLGFVDFAADEEGGGVSLSRRVVDPVNSGITLINNSVQLQFSNTWYTKLFKHS